VVDIINEDKESCEKEKDRYVEERRECVDNHWKVVFYHAFCKERPDSRTIVELATMTLGDKEIATGPLLQKSSQKSACKAHDETEEPQCARQQRGYGRMERGTVGESQNNRWLGCIRECSKLLRNLRKQVNRGRSSVGLQVLEALNYEGCYNCREQTRLTRSS